MGIFFCLDPREAEAFLVGDDTAALGFGFEPILGAAQGLVGMADGFLVVVLLFQRRCHTARSQHRVRRIDQEALRAKLIEQRPVVAHQQADAGELFQGE